jgi:iron complex outermembrane recepter protein
MPVRPHLRSALAAILFILAARTTARADPPQDGAAAAISAVPALTVIGRRLPERIDAVPASVTVLSREQVQTTAALSNNNLADALGKLVPGLGLGSQSQSTFGQTMRGRKVLVLIDGIPQHTIRNVSRDLQTISPLAIDRIEIIRGTTALYGEGAAGGIIHIITRRAQGPGLELGTEANFTTAPRNAADALGGSFSQSVADRRERFDYLAVASLERTAGLFDAEGDRIPPDPHGQGGLGDVWAGNGLARLGVHLAQDQRLELAGNHFENVQATDYTSDPTVNAAPPGSEKARAKAGLDLEDPQRTRNSLVSLSYRHARLLRGELTAQVYFRNYITRFFPFDGRMAAAYGRQIVQSRLVSRRLGARLQAGSALPFRISALYGLDASGERTRQPVTILDAGLYDASGGLVFRKLGGLSWVPEMQVGNLAPFLQLQWDATPAIAVRAGVRQELIHLEVDDFTTLAGNPIGGGALGFSKTLGNVSLMVNLPGGVSTFASVMQGHSLPDVGLILRNAPMSSTLASLNTEPQRVNAYELGVRLHHDRIEASAAGFISTSDLGTSSGGFNMPVVRAPERVHGIEATLEARITDTWRAGAAGSWLSGELDKLGDGNFTPLNTYRIPPLKLTGFIGKSFGATWEVQLFGIYSGKRDRFAGSTMFGERAVADFYLVELLAGGRVGPGRVRIGISNLLNRQHAPVTSQLLWSGTNATNAAGTGLMTTLGYALTY